MPDSISSRKDEGCRVEVEIAFLSEGHLFRVVVYSFVIATADRGKVEMATEGTKRKLLSVLTSVREVRMVLKCGSIFFWWGDE